MKVKTAEDPDQRYKGTALEGLDAYQRQLKRLGIKVRSTGSDTECPECHVNVRIYPEKGETV